MVTPEQISQVLRANVYDPELGMNVVDLGLVYGIQVDERVATITMTLTSPGCPIGPLLVQSVQSHIHQAFPELDEVNVDLVWTPPWTPEMMSDEAKEELGFF